MGRGRGIRKNRRPGGPGQAEIASVLPLTIFITLALCLTAMVGAARSETVFTDLWDVPHLLEDICRGRPTILFICDTQLSVCREGAVFFDTRADEIEERGLGAAIVFTGTAAAAREFALKTGINQAVYVDPDGTVFGTLLEEEILPALVLADGEGRHVRTLFGGGESLEGNIDTLLEEGTEEGRDWWLLAIPVAVAAAAALVFLLD